MSARGSLCVVAVLAYPDTVVAQGVRNMPGLHVLVSLQQDGRDGAERTFLANLEKMKHFPNYSASVLVRDEGVLVGYSGYEHYPVAHIESGNLDLLIEGNIYNLSRAQVIDRLLPLAQVGTDIDSCVRSFVADAQGEFIVVVYNRANRKLLVFNDSLGRLPFYYHVSNDMVLVSTEVKFIVPYLAEVRFDRRALAEYLLFRYPLGERTLLEGVCRMPPATVLSVDLHGGTSRTWQSHVWNLDSEPCDPGDIAGITAGLVSTFLDGCRQMAESTKDKTVVASLSGGYDSRTVLSGLAKVGAKPVAFTFCNSKFERELPAAKEVARILNLEHHVLPVSEVTEYGIDKKRWLAYLKDGLNSVNHYGALEFAQLVSERFQGEVSEFTGEGGDKVLAPLGFNTGVNSVAQLARSLYATDRRFTVEEVSRLLNVCEDAIWDGLEAHLASYPEATLEGKYKHFKVFERGFKWLFEGESRDRFIHWNATPFYVQRFVSACMRLPESMKKGRGLYRCFLSSINSECAGVEYMKPWRARILSGLSLILPVPVISALSSVVRKERLLDRSSDGTSMAEFKNVFVQVLEQSRVASDYFDLKEARRIIRQETSPERLMVLGTILLYMDLVKDGPGYVGAQRHGVPSGR